MSALSNKNIFPIIFGISLPLLSILNFEWFGSTSNLLRLVPPIFVGIILGYLIGLNKDRWVSLNTNLENIVEKRTAELEKKVKELNLSESKRAKTISELEKALEEVNSLSGLLPICASCKKIRDDKGYWNQIESYISEHSEADFSHGLCPDCAIKLYPEFYKEKEK